MTEVIVLAAKIATDIGIATAVGCASKKLTAPFALNVAQRIGVFCAEVAVAGLISEKTNVYIEDTFKTFEQYLEENKENKKWTRGARTDSHGK